MCGRYSNAKDLSELIKLVDAVMRAAIFGPRYNIAPTQTAPVIFMELMPISSPVMLGQALVS